MRLRRDTRERKIKKRERERERERRAVASDHLG
jgi:hypothetical protein